MARMDHEADHMMQGKVREWHSHRDLTISCDSCSSAALLRNPRSDQGVQIGLNEDLVQIPNGVGAMSATIIICVISGPGHKICMASWSRIRACSAQRNPNRATTHPASISLVSRVVKIQYYLYESTARSLELG